MNKERFSYLYQKYLNRELTFEEDQEWRVLLGDPNLDKVLQDLVDKGWFDYSDEELIMMKTSSVEKISSFITSQPQNPARFSWWRIGVAATIFMVLATGIYFFKYNGINKDLRHLAHVNDIPPGKNSATLILADGRKIVLSDALKGQVAEESGVSIVKTEDGQIVYNVIAGKDRNAESMVHNTLSTAKGETFHIRLPDGSEVWLNAASTLKYPASFTPFKERKVELSGEAYFEVSKDNFRPFFVSTNKQEVKVLGTHFNINAYSDENATKTTLIEGAVEVRPNDKSLSSIVIKPGQQAALAFSLNVSKVDVNSVVDWKNGEFIFNDQSLESIMRKLSRWYNLDVVYEDEEVRKQPIGGVVSRFINVKEVLEVLELTGFAHFKIDGRKIIVKK
ncbi:FecR family protein [Pedobacter nyackensis]|uniref:FecR family protein n=1 Tax=Pedobacter nyackensis TaxID=475255 RepID=UPI00292FBB99|nr:FecR domain-containing protein [Pedobacter nyackensis]